MSPTTVDTLVDIINCNGELIVISTQREPGESTEDFEARHQARVDAAKEECEAGGTPQSNGATWTRPNGDQAIVITDGDASEFTDPSGAG